VLTAIFRNSLNSTKPNWKVEELAKSIEEFKNGGIEESLNPQIPESLNPSIPEFLNP
jgi:hypothetical protein